MLKQNALISCRRIVRTISGELIARDRVIQMEVPFYENRKVAKNCPAVEPSVIGPIGEHNCFDIELYDFAEKLFEKGPRRNANAISARLATLNSGRGLGSKKFWLSVEGAGRFLLSNAVSTI
jgi:hypothetical protein